MGDSAKRKMRLWIPALIVAVIASLLVWLYVAENVARYVATVALPVLGLLLLGLWYTFLTGLPWRRRLAYFSVYLLLLAGAVIALPRLTRWEGSTGGGAIPRLVWHWSPKVDAALASLPAQRTPVDGAAKADSQAGATTYHFPQFLGPQRNGVIEGPLLDADWEKNPPRELWRRQIGVGWSGFSVFADRAVTQEQRGEKEMVTCYELATGRFLWAHENEARFSEKMGGDGPRSTPTIRKGKVYAIGATGILDCLALEGGALLWSRNVLEENSASNVMYGKTCSPLLVRREDGAGAGELVVVTGGGKGGPTVLAFDAATGEPVWEAGKDAASYASPVLATLSDRRQVVSLNANTVTGHALETGNVLWRYDWPANRPKSAQPQIVAENRVLVTASYGMGSALLEVSKGASGDVFEVSEVWRNLQMKTKFSNVCVRDGYVYGLDEGRLACVKLATGERMWKGGKYGYGQNLLVGNCLIVQAERGFVALVELNPEKFVELARMNALGGVTWNNPALAGEYLLLRNDREAVCFRVGLLP